MSRLSIPLLSTQSDGFSRDLAQRLAWDAVSDHEVENTVREILTDVRQGGDQAILTYTQRFDRLAAAHISELKVTASERAAVLSRIEPDDRAALEKAAHRIRIYHEKQNQASWSYTEEDGTRLGQQINPMDRVGVYVPGGKAAYPSSVLMNIIPAKVAGVKEIIMVVPTPDGVRNDLVLAAAEIAGADSIFTIGGAQAVAALAYGTESIPKVDKIVGPGNIYVATAKKMVFGAVGIDMIAGPSEILVLSDKNSNPDWVAMDLFSQAEHDENAQSILVSDDKKFIEKVQASMEKLLPSLPRREIIKESLERRGFFVHVKNMAEAVDVVNQVAPEHLELAVSDPDQLLPDIRHAGAIFMGRYTAEALGDYCAGPNHVLPTSGTARFSSPLGVYDFQKRSSLIYCSEQGASDLGEIASRLARGEGFEAHALSAEYRVKNTVTPQLTPKFAHNGVKK
ncbi:MAG: histidinol dehydrogenase [Pseudomonadales bacterium]|nr:histidinol dehydrogenase [Pseudomonadales bacterium]